MRLVSLFWLRIGLALCACIYVVSTVRVGGDENIQNYSFSFLKNGRRKTKVADGGKTVSTKCLGFFSLGFSGLILV